MLRGPYNIDVEVDIDPVDVPIDVENIRAAAAATLQSQAVDTGNMAIVLTDDEHIRSLNRQYRGIDASTDVLSFSARGEGDDAGKPSVLPPELAAELAASLGDLVIALPYTREQAKRYAIPLDAELRLLVVHGTLHLLGFDHATDQERCAMWAAQDHVLAQFGEQTPDDRIYD